MAKLIALTPCADLLPLSVGDFALREVVLERLVSVAPYKGQAAAVGARLKEQLGTSLPATGRSTGAVMWFGHGVWMVAADVSLDGLAAVTDQTDAWAVVEISGAGTEDVLARLVPVDLRAGVFKKTDVAKTMLGHMSVTITRVGPAAFEIMVMRSMARTLVHDLEVAMRSIAAR